MPKDTPTVAPTLFGKVPSQLALIEGRVVIGPDLAKRILTETNYERQRSVKPHRLHRHKTTMARGQWDPDCTIRFALLEGRLILIDGQHRLNALIETGSSLPFIILFTPVETSAQVHTLYSRIDVDGNRSVVDVLAAADPTAGRNISFEMRRHAYWALDDLANDFPHKKLKVGENDLVTKEDRIICLSFWLDEIEAYDTIVRASQSSLRVRMRNPGVVAVALATMKHQLERAQGFWTRVGENKLLMSGDPEQALVNFLLTARMNDGAKIGERGAAQAWNASFNNRRLVAIKKDPKSERPIVIAGTPFQGRA